LPKKTALEEWRKDRREPSAFITLHKIEDFHTWELSVEVQAINQRVKNVFDPAYVPSTPEEVELFDVQKNYIRSVFDKILVLDEGVTIIREMGRVPDPQKVFEKLQNEAINSTASRIQARSLMAEFSTIRYGDGTVKPGAKAFVNHVNHLFSI
jgi:hypothetical protein